VYCEHGNETSVKFLAIWETSSPSSKTLLHAVICLSCLDSTEWRVVLKRLLYWIFQAIRTLSCEARNQSVYVVVNVPEVEPCDNATSCSDSGRLFYNSDVAFDRNGTIVARWGLPWKVPFLSVCSSHYRNLSIYCVLNYEGKSKSIGIFKKNALF
jgi:hypothetical protein